jgi:nucleolar GTP-binding protein
VAVYPFTTQEVSVGTFEKKYHRYQVIDTPGLLDRELSQRNPMELRAILALKHLATIVVFLYDPTETCGYPMSAQDNLLETVKREFAKVPIVEVENKVDLVKTSSKRIKISASTGKGVDDLVTKLIKMLPTQQPL